MKQIPFDLDKYSLRFDRKHVLHNQDKNQSHAVQGIEKSLSKLVFCKKVCQKPFQKSFACFTHFEKFVWKQNLRRKAKFLKSVSIITLLSHLFNFHSNSSLLDLQSSNAQMRLEGSKIWVYIIIIGEGRLKGHQINGSLPLGNITRNLSLPQLIPHFCNLHWRMDNFGLPYQIELRFGT